MIRPPPRSSLFPYPTLLPSRWASLGSTQLRSSRSETNSAIEVRSFATEDGGSSPSVMPARIRTISARAQYATPPPYRSEEHTSELQSQANLVCRLLLETKTN